MYNLLVYNKINDETIFKTISEVQNFESMHDTFITF